MPNKRLCEKCKKSSYFPRAHVLIDGVFWSLCKACFFDYKQSKLESKSEAPK